MQPAALFFRPPKKSAPLSNLSNNGGSGYGLFSAIERGALRLQLSPRLVVGGFGLPRFPHLGVCRAPLCSRSFLGVGGANGSEMWRAPTIRGKCADVCARCPRSARKSRRLISLDPTTYGSVLSVLAGAALAACWLPARLAHPRVADACRQSDASVTSRWPDGCGRLHRWRAAGAPAPCLRR